jgi:hypothetical protein
MNVVIFQQRAENQFAIRSCLVGMLEWAFGIDHHQATTPRNSHREIAMVSMLDPVTDLLRIGGCDPVQLLAFDRRGLVRIDGIEATRELGKLLIAADVIADIWR